MITLKEIVSSNIGMLKEQEASLENSLSFVRRAIELFQSQGGSAKSIVRRRGRKRGQKPGANIVKVAKAAVVVKAVKAAKKGRKRKGGKHIDRIIAMLKERKSPVTSSELIELLFKSQTKDKDIKHFSTLIYPVLTKAYKSKTLKNKGGKITLA